MSPSRLSMLVLLAMPLVLGACRKKKPNVEPTPPTREEPRPPVTPPRTDAPAPSNNDDAARRAAEAAARARVSLTENIYFEYDADELSDAARQNLDQKIAILNANPNVRVRVSGHCDERGSDEYNIALGRRRAEAAKRYLTDRGINAGRIETTTFGRERPVVQGSSEDAWSKNRRDEFEIVAGGETLRAP